MHEKKLLCSVDEPVERSVSGLHESLMPRVAGIAHSATSILDVGCGSGAWLGRLQRQGFTNLTGIDQDVEQITVQSGREFIEADLDKLKFRHTPLPADRYFSSVVQ